MSDVEQMRSWIACKEVVTTQQLREVGVTSQQISRMLDAGKLMRVRRGVYRHPDAPISENHDLIQVVSAVPRAVVVLISALKFHEIGTQQAYQVWIQLSAGSRQPKIEWPPIEVIWTRVGALQTAGVEIHRLGGIGVPITTPARTVADCFKHRNKLGTDVCVEALRETLRSRKATIAEIEGYANLLRVGKIMRPYLEAMI